MTSLSRYAACGLVAVGLLIGALSFRPEWAAALGLDVTELPRLQEQIARDTQRRAELEEENQGVLRRVDEKQAVSREVLAGRLTLVEAAARFRTVNTAYPESMSYLRNLCSGGSDEERLCRQVIGWVEGEGSGGDRAETHRVVARLEAELQELLRSEAGIRLPEPR